MENSITIYRGDTCTIPVTITNDEGELFDLTGYRMMLSVKANKYDTDYLIRHKYATISDPTTGQGVFDFIQEETDFPEGIYWFDVEIYTIANDEGIPLDTKTVLVSQFIVQEELTKQVISI